MILSDSLGRRCSRQLYAAKRRAKNKNIEFSLTFDWLWGKWKEGVCDRTYMSFCFYLPDTVDFKAGEHFNPWAPSIDRIDPSKGYTEDNCEVVIWMYNSCKHSFDHDDVVQFAKQVIRAEDLKTLLQNPLKIFFNHCLKIKAFYFWTEHQKYSHDWHQRK